MKFQNKFIVGVILVTILLLPFYCLFLNYLEPTQIGIGYDSLKGQTFLQTGAGWHFTSPFVRIACVDTRPMRVGITTTAHAYNSKLIQFDTNQWSEFVQVEGFHYYWWANRISFNMGYPEEYRGQRDIMRGYAYDIKQYPFIKVITVYQNQ